MPAFICKTCGAQYEDSSEPPAACRICLDERQYVGWEGQTWTTLDELRASHRADLREEEAGLLGIGMEPSFAIGQRALLLSTPEGNVLWDCVPLLDEEIVRAVESAGGLRAIAISHPHYYATMAEWAREFGATVHLHAADREWVTRSDPSIVFWEADTLELEPGLTLVRLGGHFEGGTVLHWAAGAGGRGALLCGDIVQVVQDRDWVSFMRSYPNLIPLAAADVQRMIGVLEPFEFERVYGAWFGRVVSRDGKDAVRRSAERYLRALEGWYGS